MTDPAASAMREPRGAVERLRDIAFLLLLGVVACRCFLGEMPFRTSTFASVASSPASIDHPPGTDLRELAGGTYSAVIVLAGALWVLAGTIEGAIHLHHPLLALAAAAFSVQSVFSAFEAADHCGSFNASLEQMALLGGMLLAAELCRCPQRRKILIAALAAVAVAMAARGAWHLYETPYRIKSFEVHRAELLQEFGWAGGSAEEKSLEARARSAAPVGYAGLANVFASSLILLVGAGAAVVAGKWAAARSDRETWRKTRKKGEVHLPTLAAAAAVPGVLAAAVILVLTRSRGAIAASCVGVLGAMALWRWGSWLAACRRKALVVAAAVFVLCVAAVVTWGLTHDSLPTKTMTFRWFYWQAGARALADRPLLGVGGGNFPGVYLLHRADAAEEAVKAPHNVIVHAVVQYGLVGGVCYLAVIAGMLVGITRPAAPGGSLKTTDGPSGKSLLSGAAAVIGVVFVTRAILAGAADATELLVLDAGSAVAVTAIALAVYFWQCGGDWGRGGRIILGCALGAFVLHNMVTLGFWAAGPAMLFWTLGGAALAMTTSGGWTIRRLRWPAAGIAVVVVAAVIILRWVPVYNKTRLTEAASTAAARGHWDEACNLTKQAVAADITDSQPNEHLAMLYLLRPSTTREVREANLRQAYWYALMAHKLNGLSVNHVRRMVEAAKGLAALGASGDWGQKADRWTAEAVALDGANSLLRLQYAQFLAQRGQWADCLEQLARAREIQAALLEGSAHAFNESQWDEVKKLEATAREMLGGLWDFQWGRRSSRRGS